jgi:hypothetical protein
MGDEARGSAEIRRFIGRHPRSPLRARVESACEKNPDIP